VKRLTVADSEALRWFLLDCPARFGLRSGFGYQLERAAAGQLFDMGTPKAVDVPEHAIDAVRHARRVKRKLETITPGARDTLIAAYCWDQFATLTWLDRLGPVCLLTDAAQTAYQRSVDRDATRVREGSTGALLTKPWPKHRTLAQWLGPRLKADDSFRATVLSEADRKLTGACSEWYRANGC
jgi:hypothetical protein